MRKINKLHYVDEKTELLHPHECKTECVPKALVQRFLVCGTFERVDAHEKRGKFIKHFGNYFILYIYAPPGG
jgi:hypothetical protein